MSKRVVITGGTSGMGKCTVEAFLNEGDNVVFGGRDEKKAQAVLDAHRDAVEAGRLFFFKGDVSDEKDNDALYAFAMEKLGGCDVLVNNAAVAWGGMVHETDMDAFDKQFNINFRSVFYICKLFLPAMMEQKNGAIINLASDAGRAGAYNMSVYAATKAAIVNLTQSMAIDYARYGIRVNCICPSATATPMFLDGQEDWIVKLFEKNNPSQRIGKPEEIANTVVFLASDKASYIVGQIISVDGGLQAWGGEARQERATE